MELKYKCDLHDYEEALVTPEAKPLGRKMLVAVVAGILAVAGILVLTILGFSQGAATVTIIALWMGLVLVCRALPPLWIRGDFRRHPNFSREHRLVVNDEGVHYESEAGQGDTKWLAYTRCRETPNLFVLHLGARSFQVVPKRAFAGSQLEDFRQLVQRKLASKSAD